MTPWQRSTTAPRLHRSARAVVVPVVAAVALAAAGCTSGSDEAPSSSAAPGPHPVLVGGGLGEQPLPGIADGTLSGTAAVVPGAVVDGDLASRLQTAAPDVAARGLRFAPEAYDAVVLAALAAVAAQTDDGAAIAGQMAAAAAGGERCGSFQDCLPLAQQGKDFDYDGVSGPLALDASGSPVEASAAVAGFDDRNMLPGIDAPADPAAPVTYQTGRSGTEPVSDVTDPATGVTAPGSGDGRLTVATVLPMTGPLRDLGRAEAAGVRLAVADVGAAGGVFGQQVELDVEDSGDPATADAASVAASAVQAGADVVVGGGAEGLGVPLVPAVTGSGAVLVSPADASADFGAAGTDGLVFRTVAPPAVLGDVAGRVVSGGVAATIGVVQPRSAEGRQTSTAIAAALDTLGGSVAEQAGYGESDRSQEKAVTTVAAASPQAVAVVVQGTPTALLAALGDAGLLATASPSG